MEFFLWFWLLDKRYMCNMRPLLKYFSFLWFFPISIHLFMAAFNIYVLFPFKNLFTSYIISFVTIIEIISIISLFTIMLNLYNISKKQSKKSKNILCFEQTNQINDGEFFIYYEDYWIGRKNLLNANGINILVLSIIHIIWSFYYLNNRNRFLYIYKFEKIIISYSYLNIFFCAIIIFLLFCATIIKISFVISAMLCPRCVVLLSRVFCKTNKGLKKTIDFSEIQKLEPEYI